MEAFLFCLALLTLLLFAAFGIDLTLGNRSMKSLKRVEVSPSSPRPRVSIIIPARNEERNIEEALRSVLSQDYPNLEIIAVNDRSEDSTGGILVRLAKANPRLRVAEITELPKGWLGKNHALYFGAGQATGELLLFTDADVVMQPSTVSRAVGYMLECQLHHVTVLPEVRMPGILLGMFTVAFGIFFAQYARPWKAKDPKSKRFVGIGAFNLVGASVYRAAGTHQAIAMRPDDDMKLGKLIKRAGYRQELLSGRDMMRVEWYASLGELVDGLMKNAFAGVNYSVAAAVSASAFQFAVYVWPFLAVFLTRGATEFLNLGVVLVIVTVGWNSARYHGLRPWYGIGMPICATIFVYIVLKSTLLALRNDGIDWRGTHYPLAELRANKVKRLRSIRDDISRRRSLL